MYFQSLENSNNQVPESLLKDLDLWLASLAPLYTKKISSSNYAIEKKLNLAMVNLIFDFAVKRSVLKPKLIVVDDEGNSYGTFYKNSEIPSFFMNYEDNIEFKVTDSHKEIWYELVDVPKKQPALEIGEPNDREYNSGAQQQTLDTLRQTTGSNATLDMLGSDF